MKKDTFRVYVGGVCQFMLIDKPCHFFDPAGYRNLIETLERCETFAEYVSTLINGYYEKGCEVYIGRMPVVMREPYDKRMLVETVLSAYDNATLNSSFYPQFSSEMYSPTLREIGKSIHMLARFKNSDGKYVGSQVVAVDSPAVLAAKYSARQFLGRTVQHTDDVIAEVEIDCAGYDKHPQFMGAESISVKMDPAQKVAVISDLKAEVTPEVMNEIQDSDKWQQRYMLRLYSAKSGTFNSMLLVLPENVSLEHEIRSTFNVVTAEAAEMCIEAYNADDNSFVSRWYACEK